MRHLNRREMLGLTGAGATLLLGGGYAASQWQKWFGDVGVQLKWNTVELTQGIDNWPTLEHDPLATEDRRTWKQLGVTAIDAANASGQGIQAVAFAFESSTTGHIGYMADGSDFFGTPTDDQTRREVAWKRGGNGDPRITMGRLLLNGPDTPPQFYAAPTELLAQGTTIDTIRQQYPGVPYLKP